MYWAMLMKRRQIYLGMAISCVVLFAIYIIINNENDRKSVYYAEAGKINLQEWDPKKDEIICLDGEWLFYPDRMVDELTDELPAKTKVVPHSWEQDSEMNFSPYGCGTYLLEVSGLQAAEVYAVDIPDEVTSYTLYVNGKKIVSNGTVGTSRQNYEPSWQQRTGVFQTDASGYAVVVMEISNYDYNRGGFWNSPRIGNVTNIIHKVEKEKLREMFLITAILIGGVVNFGLFLFYRKYTASLYFALFCLSIACYTALTGQRLLVDILPVYHWSICVRLEYLTGYLLLPLLVLFLVDMIDQNKKYNRIKTLFMGVVVFCSIVVMIPGNLYSMFLEFYKWTALLLAIYFTYLIYKVAKNRQDGFELMLFAMAVMIISILKENLIGGLVSWVPFASLVFVCCFSYISFCKLILIMKKKDVLESRIIRDRLTGLYNREYIADIVLKKIGRDKKHKKYFMFLDLDNFKQINDTYGHDIGDYILRGAGRRFRRILKEEDIIFRYGGDEFVGIVFADRLQEVEELASRIILEFQNPFTRDKVNYHVGISIGICSEIEGIDDLETYIKFSDEAMYRAKKEGKNRYAVYDK